MKKHFKMKKCPYFILIVTQFIFFSCGFSSNNKEEFSHRDVDSFIALLEFDFKVLEDEIISLARETEQLYEHKEEIISKSKKNPLTIENGIANAAPNGDPKRSTLYISTMAKDKEGLEDLIFLTDSLDYNFREIVRRHQVVSQVYFNSHLQLNRLFPPFDPASLILPDLDITSFNFYYRADLTHNPDKGPVWLEEIYLDPAGKGWMISLLHPVYYQGELQMVLGFDITVNDILEFYLNRYSNQIVIIDEAGTVVAGKSKAIEALSLPPLINHTYIQTITSNNFRMEDFNLFKSKNKEVRKMATHIILTKGSDFLLKEGKESVDIRAKKMNLFNWYVLDLQLK
ncbi:Cache sensor protein [Rhodonellum sp.]|uniref:Cache sensor protein n=1 Tax=Rhodonellum sp. TaxID=2231180 RepID=UPI002727C38F|nr:Cache sensor protein [Rhodonellum sp.]MDO9554828.1 Cache sensor protein [Rhodonellum sp.]